MFECNHSGRYVNIIPKKSYIGFMGVYDTADKATCEVYNPHSLLADCDLKLCNIGIIGTSPIIVKPAPLTVTCSIPATSYITMNDFILQ